MRMFMLEITHMYKKGGYLCATCGSIRPSSQQGRWVLGDVQEDCEKRQQWMLHSALYRITWPLHAALETNFAVQTTIGDLFTEHSFTSPIRPCPRWRRIFSSLAGIQDKGGVTPSNRISPIQFVQPCRSLLVPAFSARGKTFSVSTSSFFLVWWNSSSPGQVSQSILATWVRQVLWRVKEHILCAPQ